MNQAWWAEWSYEPDERAYLTNPHQRQAGSCMIGPSGIYWASTPPLFTQFGKLTRVNIIPGEPAQLHFKWRKSRQIPMTTPVYIPLVSELNTMTRMSHSVSRLWEVQSEAFVPIPKRYEAEAPDLVKRFEIITKADQRLMVQVIVALIAILTVIAVLVIIDLVLHAYRIL